MGWALIFSEAMIREVGQTRQAILNFLDIFPKNNIFDSWPRESRYAFIYADCLGNCFPLSLLNICRHVERVVARISGDDCCGSFFSCCLRSCLQSSTNNQSISCLEKLNSKKMI